MTYGLAIVGGIAFLQPAVQASGKRITLSHRFGTDWFVFLMTISDTIRCVPD